MFLSVIFGCSSYDLSQKKPIAVPQTSVFPESVRWSPGPTVAYVQNIIAYKCDNCHGSGKSVFAPSNAPLISLSLLDRAKNLNTYTYYMKRSLERVVNTPSNPMPPNYGTPLLQEEWDVLKDFLNSEGG